MGKYKKYFAGFVGLTILSQVMIVNSNAASSSKAYCPGSMMMPMGDMGKHPHALGNGTVPEYAGYKLNLLSSNLKPGKSNILKYNITDSKNKIVTKYLLDMGKIAHTIIFSSDYKTYIHKHAVIDKTGVFTLSVDFPKAGTYHMDVDFSVPMAVDKNTNGAQFVLGKDLIVGGKSAFSNTTKPACVFNSNGYKISLSRTTLPLTHDTLMVSVSKNGQPVLFGKYLGTLAHMVVIRNSDRSYAHFHPMNPDGSMPPMWSDVVDVSKGNTDSYTDANPSSKDIIPFNPKEVNPALGMLHFMTEPPGAGRYTAYLQFIDGNKLQTLTFTLDAK